MTIQTVGQGFSDGISAVFRGGRDALSDRAVRRAYIHLVAALLVMGTWLVVGGVWGVLTWLPVPADAAWWMTIVYWATRIAGIGAVLLVAPVLALTLVNLVFPLLAERLFYSALATRNPARAAELMAAPGLTLRQSAIDLVRRFGRFAVLSVLVFVGSLIPVVGSIGGPLVQGYLTSRAVAWELLDPYFDKLGWRYADQREFITSHRSVLVGFGLPIAVVMMVPVLGPLLFGLAQASAARLVSDVIERPRDAAVAP